MYKGVEGYNQPDETDILWARNVNPPKEPCPHCGKHTTMWRVHELCCDHCGKYIGCND